KKGSCQVECNSFFPYIIDLCFGKFIASLEKSGNILIALRSVEQRDKNLIMGVGETFFFIPYPIVFGAIIDSSCLMWDEKCGKRGNCWVYDNEKLRYYLHGATFVCITVGSVFDLATLKHPTHHKESATKYR
ncbi:solute carrier organic anion transporter family member 4C1-like protein, partial [Leptotrombidium deliense]